MVAPLLEYAFTIEIELGSQGILEAGDIGKGIRRVIPISGGSFSGPGIRGRVVPGGYDWQILRNDGVLEIDARYLLETNGGSLITIVNTGFRWGSPDVMQKMQRGEEVPADAYYFRTVPVFECADAEYAWLNRHIFIGRGIRQPGKVKIEVWKVN